MSLILRDESTGISKEFQPTLEGYAQAEAFKQAAVQQGHRISDCDSNALSRIDSYFGSNGNCGRPGSPHSWF